MISTDPRFWLYEKLMQYSGWNDTEKKFRTETLKFLEEDPNCFETSNILGHITGEAWVINKEKTKILLTHHKTLDRWFQLGGHSDGDPITLNVALREAQEESGLEEINILSENLCDIDVHPIPEKKGIPEHTHYGIAFLFEADENSSLILPKRESKELRWVAFEEILELNPGRQRMVEKLNRFKEKDFFDTKIKS